MEFLKLRAMTISQPRTDQSTSLDLLSAIFFSLATACTITLVGSCQALAQSAPPNLSPISLNPIIAQAAPSPQIIPTDATPFTVSPERNAFTPGYKFRIFQALPERLYFTASTEVSQRLDTNVLFTSGRAKADYAFRVLPNITVGYNVAKNTSVFANYFVIKDTFAVQNFLNKPTTQSLAWGIQHNKQLGKKTNLQLTFQARELWQARRLHQFDFIPGATITHMVNPNNILYASALLQMRGGGYFVAPTREIDPFYTIGYIHRRGPWTFIATDTLVTNFRQPTFKFSVPDQSNISMIADFEVNRPLSKKFPSVLAFARAEPIWNWASNKTPGISGFDFRFFTGLRFIVSKPSYYASTQNLKKQLMKEQENRKSSPTTQPTQSPATPNSSSVPSSGPSDNSGAATSPSAVNDVTPGPRITPPPSEPTESDATTQPGPSASLPTETQNAPIRATASDVSPSSIY